MKKSIEPQPNFTSWLSFNRWRADPVGDLARDAYTDPHWPPARHYLSFVAYLHRRHAREVVLETLQTAWDEFELYFGGPSELHPHTWVFGVAGNGLPGKRPPKPAPFRWDGKKTAGGLIS